MSSAEFGEGLRTLDRFEIELYEIDGKIKAADLLKQRADREMDMHEAVIAEHAAAKNEALNRFHEHRRAIEQLDKEKRNLLNDAVETHTFDEVYPLWEKYALQTDEQRESARALIAQINDVVETSGGAAPALVIDRAEDKVIVATLTGPVRIVQSFWDTTLAVPARGRIFSSRDGRRSGNEPLSSEVGTELRVMYREFITDTDEIRQIVDMKLPVLTNEITEDSAKKLTLEELLLMATFSEHGLIERGEIDRIRSSQEIVERFGYIAVKMFEPIFPRDIHFSEIVPIIKFFHPEDGEGATAPYMFMHFFTIGQGRRNNGAAGRSVAELREVVDRANELGLNINLAELLEFIDSKVYEKPKD